MYARLRIIFIWNSPKVLAYLFWANTHVPWATGPRTALFHGTHAHSPGEGFLKISGSWWHLGCTVEDLVRLPKFPKKWPFLNLTQHCEKGWFHAGNLSSVFFDSGARIFGRDCKVVLPDSPRNTVTPFCQGNRMHEIWLGMSKDTSQCCLWISDISTVCRDIFCWVFLLKMPVQSEDHGWEEYWWDMVITIRDFILDTTTERCERCVFLVTMNR